MNRRNLFIILGAVALALIVGLIWFWFFTRTPSPGPSSGSFGTGGNRTGTSTTATGGGNVGSPVQGGRGGNTTNTNIAVPIPGGGVGTTLPGGGGTGGGGTTPVDTVPGVDWLGPTTGGGGPITSFVPATINQLNSGGVGGTPGLLGGAGGTGEGGTGGTDYGLTGILGAGAGCAAYAAFQAAGAGTAAGQAATGVIPIVGSYVLVYDFFSNSKQASNQFKDLGDCLARTIGKAVIQQMTNSIVNWINSGFNGQPSFVTNYQNFFTNVGDQAAGEFIRGTALSFLCSPFRNQIRIAIAQSYARRNAAASCSLSSVVNNINNFMNGSWNGWAGMLEFTTVPINNPFGAFAYAESRLIATQQAALSNANRNVSPGGFIGVYKCDPPGTTDLSKCRISTPSAVVESTLNETLKQPFLANQLAKSFEEIITALLNQLVTRTLYEGLSTLSGQQGYSAGYLTPAEQQAQQNAQALMVELQGLVTVSQQYGAVWQGAISDIQNTQRRIQSVVNCWEIASSSPALEDAKRAQAQSNAMAQTSLLHSYDPQIATYNERITRANESIAKLQEIQTDLVSASSVGDINKAKQAYQQAAASGAIITAAEVTSAQQDRTALQSTLQTRNQQADNDLAQCNAY